MTEPRIPDTTQEPDSFAPVTEERVLMRSDEGRMLTGVCAGLGRYTGMDPVIFRVGFAVLVVGSGIGIMLYIAAFLLMRSTDGGPGYIEQWSRRIFDTETVMAILAAVFGFGLIINLAAGGISTATVVVGTLLAISLLAAHARGIDLLALTKSMPERLVGRKGTRPAPEHWDGAPFGRPFGAPPAPPFMSTANTPPGATRAASNTPPADTRATEDAPPADVQATSDASPYAAARPGTAAPYRRLADLAQEARGAFPEAAVRRGGYNSSGEPFAPRGPYGPRRPYEPHDWGYGAQVAIASERAAHKKRPKSYIGGITMFIAFVVGGIMVATQSTPNTFQLPVVGGAVLITIGAGLLVATWFGRGAGLVAIGTIMSLILVAGSTMNDLPRNIGSYIWEPVDSSQTVRTYSVGIGEGTLDLRDTKFAPGSRTRFDASVSVGELKIIVPRTARVEVFGYARLGDVKIEHNVRGGADVHHDKVLEPDTTPTGAVPVIELHLKAGIGDVEVRRAA